MKKLFFILPIVALLYGCASIPVSSNNSVVIPEKVTLTADSKPIEKIASLVGQTFNVSADKQVKGKDGSTARKIDLKSDGLAQVVKWFIVGGGLFLVGAIVLAAFFKAYGLAFASGLSGFAIIIGTLFFKLFAVAIAWFTLAVLVAGLAYEAWVYRKKLTIKNAVKVVKDLADDGKLNGSSQAIAATPKA